MYQELARLGSPEQQALLHKQLDDLAAPISFCKYKLKMSNDDDAGGLSVPDSPSAKVIQAIPLYSKHSLSQKEPKRTLRMSSGLSS